MTKNLQDLRAEAKAEFWELMCSGEMSLSQRPYEFLDTLIDSVLDRAEKDKKQALLDVRRETIEEIVDKAASVFHPYCCGENTNCFDKLVKITKND